MVVESQSEVLGDQEAKLQTLEKTVQHAHDALQALKEPETTQELQCEPDKLVNDTPLVKMLDSIFSEESTNSDNKSIQPSALLQEHSQTLHEHEERLNTAMEKIQNVWDSLNKGPASSMVSMQQELAQLKSLLESLRQKHDALKTENNDELQLQQRLLDNLFSGFVVAFVLLVFICMFHKCGRSKHRPKRCPAKDATCHQCKKKGHFKGMCRSHKKVDNISDDEECEDEFLGSIAIDELNEDNDWKVQLKLENVLTTFKLDTEADVTVVPKSVYEKTGKLLKKTETNLTGPGQYNLQVLGMMEAEITASPDKSTKQKVYVKQAFQKLKKELSDPIKILAHYDPAADTVVSADASSYGLGDVVTQLHENGEWRLAAYNSRSMSETEKWYPQIDKEYLAVTWACERFSDLLIGITFKIETGHKPIIPLLGNKDLDLLPPRVQRFRMRLMRFSFNIVYVPGKERISADALSRAPLKRIVRHQKEDETCQLLFQYCPQGWAEKVQGTVKHYQPVAAEITVQNGILMRGCRIIIPLALRMEMLEKLHAGHLGLVKCRQRARQSVWWPSLGNQLEELITNFSTCSQHRIKRAETLITIQNFQMAENLQTKETVQKEAETRSYYVNTEKVTEVRRNRKHLNHLPEERNPDKAAAGEQNKEQPKLETANADTTQTRSGRVIQPPKRFVEEC
ncbi:Retrovirus-related Pol polyprotein from transposon 17.6 [Exaiptasia diaphana]|nr:Retrovirus-related Pol polyprotein from transposon 17.6 [Exaiptasia diaphana]